MIVQNKAIIHLADQRGFQSAEGKKSYSTFSFGTYQNENRLPFGALRLWNEEILSADHSLTMETDQPTDVIILPLAGIIEYKDGNGNESFISAGQIYVASLKAHTNYQLINPFEKEEVVICLQIWFSQSEQNLSPTPEQITFDLSQINQLLPLLPTDKNTKPYNCYIGKYEGRIKGEYILQNRQNGLYGFVITGAFELQDRLLQDKDGLALWEVGKIDFEALSGEAILILFEVPIPKS